MEPSKERSDATGKLSYLVPKIAGRDAQALLGTETGLLKYQLYHFVPLIINIFRALNHSEWKLCSTEELIGAAEVAVSAESALNYLEAQISASPVNDLENEAFSELTTQLNEIIDKSVNSSIGTILSKTYCISPYFNSREDDATGYYNEVVGHAREAKEIVRQANEDRTKLTEEIQRLQSVELTNKFGGKFGDDSKTQNIVAHVWTGAGVVIAWYCIKFLSDSMSTLDQDLIEPHIVFSNLLPIALIRLGLAAVLFYGIAFCFKTASSYRHNSIINRHRENALVTFPNIITSVTEPASKDAVVIQAMQTIYGTQSTGFTSTDSIDTPQSATLLELVKSLITSKPGGG